MSADSACIAHLLLSSGRLNQFGLGVVDNNRAVNGDDCDAGSRPAPGGDFWTSALGYEPKRETKPDDDFMIFVPASGEGAHIALDVSGSQAPGHPSVHLDLDAGDAADQAAEVDRLFALGATRVAWDFYGANPDFVVLADTEGNRFCIIDTSHS